jgi:hypothetical protein
MCPWRWTQIKGSKHVGQWKYTSNVIKLYICPILNIKLKCTEWIILSFPHYFCLIMAPKYVMHGESDVTTTRTNLTSYFPNIPAFTNRTLQLDRKYRLYQKVTKCKMVFYLKFWITYVRCHRKGCAETKTDFLHTQNMIFCLFRLSSMKQIKSKTTFTLCTT